MTKFVSLCDRLSSGIWLYALFMSAIKTFSPLIHLTIVWIGSMVQLHFVSSIIVLSWRASKTIFSDSPFLSIITGLIKVFTVVIESVFTGAIISKCVRISSKCCTRSCN